jgi:hypothetical protein
LSLDQRDAACYVFCMLRDVIKPSVHYALVRAHPSEMSENPTIWPPWGMRVGKLFARPGAQGIIDLGVPPWSGCPIGPSWT